jgi:hypothetical protein
MGMCRVPPRWHGVCTRNDCIRYTAVHACRHGVDPYVVHATFQRYPTSMARLGKRGRFRWVGW